MTAPILHLVVGSNGAGKSSLVSDVIAPITHLPVVNADVIAARRWPKTAAAHAYDAAAIAARERDKLIRQRASFIAETVFSHESKLDLIRGANDAGYMVILHVVVIPVDLTVMRVEDRIANGGHDVPEDKIRSRYARLWRNVAAAIVMVGEAHVYDNSRASRPLDEIAVFVRGVPMGPVLWPAWAPSELKALT